MNEITRWRSMQPRSSDVGHGMARWLVCETSSRASRVDILPGGVAGGLWSLGNICSMLSVQGLGEGVGYSVVQGSMLVSGLWGVYYYQEVTSKMKRLKWLAAAVLMDDGALPYERRCKCR